MQVRKQDVILPVEEALKKRGKPRFISVSPFMFMVRPAGFEYRLWRHFGCASTAGPNPLVSNAN